MSSARAPRGTKPSRRYAQGHEASFQGRPAPWCAASTYRAILLGGEEQPQEGYLDPRDTVARAQPRIAQASASTVITIPAHCQGVICSPSRSKPLAMPTTGTPRLNGATLLAPWRFKRLVH